MRRWLPMATVFLLVSCVQIGGCPSPAGGTCDPRNANCPKGYGCAVAEVCTRTCEQTSDCWLSVTDGCRGTTLPGMRLPDGGVFTEEVGDGFCPESKIMVCLAGYCQRDVCLDGGCDYDLYGPSTFKGNRSQGPNE